MIKTNVDIELTNGEVVQLSLTFGALYRLRNERPEDYKAYNNLIVNGTHGDLDDAIILYTAYLCAHLDTECIGIVEFLDLLPTDRTIVTNAVVMLLQPEQKKRQLASEMLLKRLLEEEKKKSELQSSN